MCLGRHRIGSLLNRVTTVRVTKLGWICRGDSVRYASTRPIRRARRAVA